MIQIRTEPYVFETANGNKIYSYLVTETYALVSRNIKHLPEKVRKRLIEKAPKSTRTDFIRLPEKLSEAEVKDWEAYLNSTGAHLYTLQTNFTILTVGQRFFSVDPSVNQVINPSTGEVLPRWRYSVLASSEDEAKQELARQFPELAKDIMEASFDERNQILISKTVAQPAMTSQVVEDLEI